MDIGLASPAAGGERALGSSRPRRAPSSASRGGRTGSWGRGRLEGMGTASTEGNVAGGEGGARGPSCEEGGGE
jgi:hypothetical protein